MILTKNKSLKILSVFFAIFMSSYSYGQSMIVKGKVVDEKGVPLIGVTIIEEGINNGAAAPLLIPSSIIVTPIKGTPFSSTTLPLTIIDCP